MIDRSISSLRTLRPETEFDKSIFWFRDDLQSGEFLKQSPIEHVGDRHCRVQGETVELQG